MSVFLKATKAKLRFSTPKGSLSTEQMWDLTLDQLDSLAVSLQEDYEASKGKSFITKKSRKDRGIKLKFDVVLSILQTKMEDSDRASKALSTREHNSKILALIQEKREGALKDLSVEELEDMLK